MFAPTRISRDSHVVPGILPEATNEANDHDADQNDEARDCDLDS